MEREIVCGDCLVEMQKMEAGSVDLVFADPPFNVGYTYDVYNDRRNTDEYLEWSQQWMGAVKRVLKPSGAFWLAIGDEFAAELKVAATHKLGFCCRSWVIWHYAFGVHCTKKFARSHTHLFHFVKDRANFTFNADAIRVPSARQITYRDKRANQKGRVPGDVWCFPRVCGTFKERVRWHPCQMPLAILDRILRVSSNEGELVLDPFAGSGTTLVAAKKLGRRSVGVELSVGYVGGIKQRLAAASPQGEE